MKLVEILAREMDEWPDQPVPVPWVCKDGLVEVMFCHDHSIKEGNPPVAVMVYGCVFIGPVTRETWQAERKKLEGPDWSKAPEGATHWGAKEGGNIGGWYRVSEGRTLRLSLSGWFPAFRKESELIPRPTQQWNGEGLPPVGEKVEMRFQCGKWYPVTPIAYGEKRVFFRDASGKERLEYISHFMARPILPQEQNKSKEREAALKEIMDTTGACRTVAEELYNAGYRKQEASK